MTHEKILSLLANKLIVQSQVFTPLEGDKIEILMRRKHPESTFVVIECAPLVNPPAKTQEPIRAEFIAFTTKGSKRDRQLLEQQKREQAWCHRPGKDYGPEWAHQYDPESKVCLWCGDGAGSPPPEAYEKVPERRLETVPCAEHGMHQLDIRQDGSYEKPDCEMFKR